MKRLLLIIALFFITGCDSGPPTPTTKDVQSHIDDALKSKGVAVDSVKCESYPSTTETAAGRTSCAGKIVLLKDVYTEFSSNKLIIKAFENAGLSWADANYVSQWIPLGALRWRNNQGKIMGFTGEFQYQRQLDKWSFQGNIEFSGSDHFRRTGSLSVPDRVIVYGDTSFVTRVADIVYRFNVTQKLLNGVERQITNFFSTGSLLMNYDPIGIGLNAPITPEYELVVLNAAIWERRRFERTFKVDIGVTRWIQVPSIRCRGMSANSNNTQTVQGEISFKRTEFESYISGHTNKRPNIVTEAGTFSGSASPACSFYSGPNAWNGDFFRENSRFSQSEELRKR